MKIRLLFFSVLQDLVGTEAFDWELSAEEQSVAEFLADVYAKFPELEKWDERILVAIDLEYVKRDAMVRPGQEVAIMPPVQGG